MYWRSVTENAQNRGHSRGANEAYIVTVSEEGTEISVIIDLRTVFAYVDKQMKFLPRNESEKLFHNLYMYNS